MKTGKNTESTIQVFYGERGYGRKHYLIKIAISYILDEEYKKAKEILDKLQNIK